MPGHLLDGPRICWYPKYLVLMNLKFQITFQLFYAVFCIIHSSDISWDYNSIALLNNIKLLYYPAVSWLILSPFAGSFNSTAENTWLGPEVFNLNFYQDLPSVFKIQSIKLNLPFPIHFPDLNLTLPPLLSSLSLLMAPHNFYFLYS